MQPLTSCLGKICRKHLAAVAERRDLKVGNRWSGLHLWQNSIVGSHDRAPDNVQAFAVAGDQDADVVGMLHQGQARVFGVLHVWGQHWVPQQIDTIQDDGGRSHDLHDEHIPAVGNVGPQVEGLGDTDPEVEDEGAEVQEEDDAAKPVDLCTPHVALEFSWLWQAHEGAWLGLHFLGGIEGCCSVLPLARRGNWVDWHYSSYKRHVCCQSSSSQKSLSEMWALDCAEVV